MSDLLMIQNVGHEGPGLLAEVLEKHKITYDVVGPAKDLPSVVGYKALVILGGPASANDDGERITGEIAMVKQALQNGLPFLGVCLGMQILVKAAGGNIIRGRELQAGFIDPAGQPYTITFTEDGKADRLLDGLKSPVRVFQLHGEVAELNADMKLLGTEPVAPNQIVRVGTNAYGIQSHFELTEEMLQVWAVKDPALVPIGAPKLLEQFSDIKHDYAKTGETLLTNFLKIAGLV
ncbi:MAG TPA: type 1 glutamine amidotransferase [Candidatus Saccharimonadales bacterium]